MTFTKNSIKQELNNIDNDFYDEAHYETEKRMKESDNKSREIRNKFLSPLFDNKEIFSLSTNETIVYCDTLDETKNVVEKAQSFGFRNICTYIPKTSDGSEFGSKNDPERPYAVRICESESLIFGTASKAFLKLFNEIVEPFSNKIIYTYCYNDQATFSFRDKLISEQFLILLDKAVIEFNQRYFLKLKTSHYSRYIDTFTISIQVA